MLDGHEAKKKQVVKTIERYAHLCVNHPPQGHFHERKFINHCFIGFPFHQPSTLSGASIRLPSESVRIVHAPSNPLCKGTDIVRALIGKLRHAGEQIEYVELIERPNHEVLRELQCCDFVIDELYSDIPLAGLGTEAAFFGKPTVVGGYAQDELNRYASQTGLPMELYVRPEEVELVVRRLIQDKAYRIERGKAAYRFVLGNWTPQQVAQRFLQLIEGEIPNDWWYNPSINQCLYGWGAGETAVRRYIRQFVQQEGIDALQLADKPDLEQAFLNLANA